MPGNPQIALGTLNRLQGSVTIVNFPELNVTAPFLSTEGIRLAFEGEATLMIPVMTGMVTSPEPYVVSTVTVHLLKSQSLADAYKQQMELTTLIGDVTVRADSPTLSAYDISNASIEAVEALDFSGRTANFIIRLRGAYFLNSDLFP